MTAEEFRERWGPGLIQLSDECPGGRDVLPEALSFLVRAGLPREAAPFLSFDELEGGLRRIYEIWGRNKDYPVEEKARLEPYLVLGSDGSGNPICLDTANDCRVVHVDHDDWFRTITFVNSDVACLAEFLLVIREAYERASQELSERGLEDGMPLACKTALLERLEEIDPDAIGNDNFWKGEIGML